jgi:hypothetical protein
MATGIPIELEQEYQRNKEVRAYFRITANQTKVNADTPLKDRQTDFETHLQEFEDLMPGKDITTTGITSGKEDLQKQVATLYAPICKRTLSYAKRYGHTELAANMNFNKSKILNLADGEVFAFATATNGYITDPAVMGDLLFAPYNVTPAMLTAALGVATAFKDSIGQAGSTSAGVTALIASLKAKDVELDEDIDDFEDLMSPYETSDPDFFNGWRAAKVINNIGYNHSGIEGIVTNASGVPQKDVRVECLQNNKKVDLSDLVGHFEIRNFIPRLYEFKFSHPTLGEKTIVAKIERGRVLTLNVQLGS